MATTTRHDHTYDPEPDAYWEAVTDYWEGMCPACGSPADYCQGHGEIGDPAGFAILEAHDADDHDGCHPDGCFDICSG